MYVEMIEIEMVDEEDLWRVDDISKGRGTVRRNFHFVMWSR